LHGTPPGSVAVIAGSALGSGGRFVDSEATGSRPVPAAQGLALMAASPAARNALAPLAPHVVAVWPDSSKPSAHIALLEPELPPAEQEPPPAIHVCAFA